MPGDDDENAATKERSPTPPLTFSPPLQLLEEAEALTERIATPGLVSCPEPEQPPPLPPRHERLRFFVYPSEVAREMKQQQLQQQQDADGAAAAAPGPSYNAGPLKPLQVTVERESPRYQYRELLFETLSTKPRQGQGLGQGQGRSRSAGSSLSSSLHNNPSPFHSNSTAHTHALGGLSVSTHSYTSAHSSLPSSVASSPSSGFRGLSIHGAISPFPSPDRRGQILFEQQQQQQAAATAAANGGDSGTVTPSRCVCFP